MIIDYNTLIPSIYQQCQNAIKSGEKWELMANKTTWAIFDSELKAAFDATVLDMGGHNESSYAGIALLDLEKSTSRNDQQLHEGIKESVMDQLKYLVDDVHSAILKETPYEEIKDTILLSPVHFYITPVLNKNSFSDCYCFVCGKRTSYYLKDGIISAGSKIDSTSPYWETVDRIYKIWLTGESENDLSSAPCAYPDGIEKYDQYITIKSNHLVFANDLRDIVNVDHIESMKYISEQSGYHNNINSEVGCIYNQEYALDKGLIMVQVGNTSPIIAQNADTGVIVAVDPNAWKSKKRYTFPIDVAGFKSKGNICTGVWTVQAVDSIVFEAYAEENQMSLEKAAKKHGFLVPIQPGKYKITNYNAHHYTDRPVFFSMERVD